MAVTSATLLSTEQGSWEGEQGAGNVRSYRTQWLVVCDDKLDGPSVVLSYGGLPALYSAYVAGNDSDPQALLTKKTPTLKSRSNAGNAWIVSCEYSTAADQNQSNLSPEDRPPALSGSFVQFMRPLDIDIDGRPLQNTVGEPFDPTIEVEDSRPVLAITKLFTFVGFDYVFLCSYRDCVNSDTFTIRGLAFPPDSCKLQSLSFQEVWINGANYIELTAEVEIKPERWNPRVIANVGLMARQPDASGPISRILADDGSGEPIQLPVNLLEDGTRCLPGVPPAFLEFRPYQRRPFSLLNLG